MAEDLLTATGIAQILVDKFEVGTRAEVVRVIRHYTAEGLIRTVGAVNTGTGKRRLYSKDALLKAAVLLRLNRLGVPVGMLKEMMKDLPAHLRLEHKGLSFLAAAQALEDPHLFLEIPGGLKTGWRARLFERENFSDPEAGGRDLIVVPLRRFLNEDAKARSPSHPGSKRRSSSAERDHA